MVIVIPTRRPLVGRLLARVRVAYLNWRTRHATADMEHHQAELQHALSHLPQQIDRDKAYLASLAKRLARATQEI